MLNEDEGRFERLCRIEKFLIAVGKGNTQELKNILDDGFDVNDRNSGAIALHFAAQVGHLDTIKYLLEGGVDIGTKDDNRLLA